MDRDQSPSNSSIDLITRASSGRAPHIARMPAPTHRLKVPMRDGVGLDTWVWLPEDRPGPFPAILTRTPYQEHVLGWARLDPLAYREAGYAVVFQMLRGLGSSEGAFVFFNPLEGEDGAATIAWIAAQVWSDGRVGMDGSSYAGMTQLMAAAAQPPALCCIAPAVVSAHPFLHVPRWGGGFARQHTLGWSQIVAVESLADLTPGLWGAAALLTSPESWKRLLHRPAIEAADGVLSGAMRDHYRGQIEHDVFDAYHQARTLSAEAYARISTPCLMISGAFDTTTGSHFAWRALEMHAPADVERLFLIGPWDHGQAYVGGGRAYGPWSFGPAADFDLPAARRAFFDKHLKGEGPGPVLPGRVSAFLNGANTWIGMTHYPDPAAEQRTLYLAGDGFANLRGHGRLSWRTPKPEESACDSFESDPSLPFIPVAATLDPDLLLDLREIERLEDVLVYTSDPLDAPLALFGEFEVVLHLAADTPDCDVVCWLALALPDGGAKQLSWGLLRLRYREGFDCVALLEPGIPVSVRVPMHYVAHEVPAGSCLKLLIGGGLFPLIDPNPNTGEPIAHAVRTQIARQTIFHDAARASHVKLPVLRLEAATS